VKDAPDAARESSKTNAREVDAMLKALGFALSLLLFLPRAADAADGLITVKSPHPVDATAQRLEGILKDKGMTIFAKVDHAAGAQKVGKSLRPTQLLIFGNPQGGTPFMECSQTVGIDLPLKALVWEDEAGQVWLGYNDPAVIAARHQVPDCPAAGKIKEALANFAKAATAP
jgi:uncharacterized protein (DUF302 family)